VKSNLKFTGTPACNIVATFGSCNYLQSDLLYNVVNIYVELHLLDNKFAVQLVDGTTRSGHVALHAPSLSCIEEAPIELTRRVLAIFKRRGPAGQVGDLSYFRVVFAIDLGDTDNLVVVEDVGGVPVGGPLGQDQQAQIAENGVDENHFGDVDPV